MARPINFDDLNLNDTEYIAPDFVATMRYNEFGQLINDDDPPILVSGGGGSLEEPPTYVPLEITPHAIHPPVLYATGTEPIGTESTNDIILGVPVTGNGNVITGNAVTPTVDYAAKLQTLAAERPLLVFGAIGLGLYFLLKDKK